MLCVKQILHNSFVLKKAYESRWTAISEKYAFTLVEIEVLGFLANNPELNTARDIVRYRQIAKSHVSKAVDNLTARGYLRSEPAAEDRRCNRLTVTAEAEEAVQAIRLTQCGFAAALLEGITDEERAQLAAISDRITANAIKLLGE